MSFLVFHQASYGYKRSFHLSDICFKVIKGEITGIIGPNGSGKSTLFKGLTGELPLSPNQVFLEGEDLSTLEQRVLSQKVAIVSQFSEPLDITVEEYVLTGRIPYRKRYQFFETTEDFEKVEQYMTLTHTLHLRDKKYSQLSGGEQQLVSIAKALTQEPALLLLDEPTAHLDIAHQVEILNLIHKLSHQCQLTVVMIIHDLNLASEYCDHLVLMKKGAVFVHGTPAETLTFQNIEEVYNTVVVTQENPLSKKPAVFLVSHKVLTDTR